MLEKIETIEEINVGEKGQIQVRKVVKVFEDGEEISKANQLTMLYPGQDLAGQDTRVVAIANAVWTTEVIATYQESLTAQLTN